MRVRLRIRANINMLMLCSAVDSWSLVPINVRLHTLVRTANV